jgi:hypothetical protein
MVTSQLLLLLLLHSPATDLRLVLRVAAWRRCQIHRSHDLHTAVIGWLAFNALQRWVHMHEQLSGSNN